MSAASPAPSDTTEVESPIMTPLPISAVRSSGKEQQHTLGLYYAPTLPLEPGLESVGEPSKAPTVVNLFADANLGLGLVFGDSVTEKLASSVSEQRLEQHQQQQHTLNAERCRHIWVPYLETPAQPLQGPPPSATHTPGAYFQPLQPQRYPGSAPITPCFPHHNAISPAELHTPLSNAQPIDHCAYVSQQEHHGVPATPADSSPSTGVGDDRLGTGSSAPVSVSGEVPRLKRNVRLRNEVDDDERERRAERRRQINRKSARNFREKRKTAFETLEQVNADHVATIQRLERELAAERTERVRLEGLVRTRGHK